MSTMHEPDSLQSTPSKRPVNSNDQVLPEPKRLKEDSNEPSAPQETADSIKMQVDESDAINSGPSSGPTKPKKKERSWKESFPKKQKGKEKDNKSTMRPRRGTRKEGATPSEDNGGEDSEQTPKAPRLPKRQTALLIGFCGTGCSGMQIQKNARTIEGILFDALVKVGAVSQDNADDPVKVNLGRAARTDAGVHAAGNLVSMKMITAIPDVPDVVARVNEELPPEIRLWGTVRVQNSFNARALCDSRKYTYFFPTYLLIPSKPGSLFYNTLERNSSTPLEKRDQFWDLPASGNKDASEPQSSSSSTGGDLHRKRDWRIGEAQVQALKETAQKFVGTHNFHNFTVGREFSERSCQRHMKMIEVSDPVVYGETEWMSVLFHGQSFMLHQIRKMMSALVLSCRTETPKEVIDELYGARTVFVPKMPSLGLLLEYPIFDTYNNKVSAVNEKLTDADNSSPDYRPPIDFEIHRGKIDLFKQKHIYDRMREIEDRDGVFDAWIRSIDAYGGNDLGWLNSKGVIPVNAVIKKGERRANPFKERKMFDSTAGFSKSDGVEMTVEELEEEDDEVETLSKKNIAETEG